LALLGISIAAFLSTVSQPELTQPKIPKLAFSNPPVVKPLPDLPEPGVTDPVKPSPTKSETPAEVPTPMPPQPEPQQPIELSLEELRKLNDKVLAAEIEKRITAAKDAVAAAKKGHVIVGRVILEGDGNARDAFGQMEILDQGYFVEAVATRDAPLGIWCPGYATTYLIPKTARPIEWIGDVTLKKLKKPASTIEGWVLVNGEIPGKIDISVDYKGWPLNVIARNGASVEEIRSELARKLAKHFPPKTSFDPKSTAFKISGLAAGAASILMSGLPSIVTDSQLAQPGGHLFDVDLESDDMLAMGVLQIGTPGTTANVVEKSPTNTPSRVKDGTPIAERLVAQFGLAKIQKDGETFAQRVQRDLNTLKEYRAKNPEDRQAVLLVGQVRADGLPNHLLPEILSQGLIWPEGCFSILAREGRPVGFRLHGYEPLDYVPKGSEGLIEYVEMLTLQRPRLQRLGAIEGQVIFEGGRIPSNAVVELHACIDKVSSHDNSGKFDVRWGRRFPVSIRADGRFQVNGISSIRHEFWITAPGFKQEDRIFHLAPSEKKSLPPIFVQRDKEAAVSTLTSQAGGFLKSREQSFVPWPTDQGPFRHFDVPSWEGIGIIGVGLWLGLGYNKPVAYLGTRELKDYRDIDIEDFEPPGRYRLQLREGAVYLVKIPPTAEHPQAEGILLKVHAIRPKQ
jgi:hypothetical protein